MSEEEEIYGKNRKIKVDVEVDSKSLKESLKRQNQLEEENESLQTELEDAQNKLKIVAEKAFEDKKRRLNCNDDSIRTPSQLREWEEENSSNFGEPPIGKGSAGSLKLKDAQGTKNPEFDSEQQMIDYLVNLKHTGSSAQKQQAEAVLNRLYEKTAKGLEEGLGKQGVIFEDKKCVERGESILFKALRLKNEELRRRALENRKKGEK